LEYKKLQQQYASVQQDLQAAESKSQELHVGKTTACQQLSLREHEVTATHCNTLPHVVTHCNALQYTSNALQHSPTHSTTLERIATRCNTLQHTATHYSTIQHTTTHCNTLQHTATHCNTLQHTATHCNTLQHTATNSHELHTSKTSVSQKCQQKYSTAELSCVAKVSQKRSVEKFDRRVCFQLFCDKSHELQCVRTATHCNTLQHTATHCNTLFPALL